MLTKFPPTRLFRDSPFLGSNYGSDSKTKRDQTELQNYRAMLGSYRIQSVNESDHPSVPKFLHHPPPILYASKGQPATIHCVAQPVVLLYSVCTINLSDDRAHGEHSDDDAEDSEENDEDDEEVGAIQMVLPNLTSPDGTGEFRRKNVSENIRHVSRSGHSRWEITRFITAQTVEEWFGDFWCYCEAWNNVLEFGEPRVAFTPRTYIQIACEFSPVCVDQLIRVKKSK